MKKIKEQIKVILVDDDCDDRLIFEDAIQQVLENCEVITFSDGSEITNYLRDNENRNNLPDIVFMDINMPKVNGIEALKIIRHELRIDDLTIAMYSTSTVNRDIEAAFIGGANIYVNKPSSMPLLVKSLYKLFIMKIHHNKSDLDQDTFMFTI